MARRRWTPTGVMPPQGGPGRGVRRCRQGTSPRRSNRAASGSVAVTVRRSLQAEASSAGIGGASGCLIPLEGSCQLPIAPSTRLACTRRLTRRESVNSRRDISGPSSIPTAADRSRYFVVSPRDRSPPSASAPTRARPAGISRIGTRELRSALRTTAACAADRSSCQPSTTRSAPAESTRSSTRRPGLLYAGSVDRCRHGSSE